MATQKQTRNEGVEPTRGIAFDDTRYSGHKYLVADDDREFNEGDLVYIGTATTVYGPYRIGKMIAEGNGKRRYLAFAEGSNGTIRNKPLTKAELEAENAKLQAQLAEAQAKAKQS